MRNTIRFPAAISHLLATAALTAVGACVPDGERSPAPAASDRAAAETRPCAEISVDCGRTPSLAFDRSGRLWVAFEQEGHTYVVRSDDRGASFSAPDRKSVV